MAREVHEFVVTVAHGAGSASAPVVTDLSIPAGRRVTQLELYVPPGPRGTVGLAVAFGSQQVLPWESGTYVVTDDDVIRWPLTGFPTGGDWRLLAYSTGGYDHTVRVVLLCTLGAATKVATPTIPTAVLSTPGTYVPPPATPGPVTPTPTPPALPPPSTPVLPPPPTTPVLPPPPATPPVPPPPATPPTLPPPPTVPPPAPTPAPAPPPVTFPAVAVLGGGSWYVLGGFTPSGTWYGRTVGGGYPVAWTWTGNGTPEVGQFPPAGATGVVGYTPTSTPLGAIGPLRTAGVPPWSRNYTGTA